MELDEQQHKEIKNFLLNFEKEKDIKLIFVCEIASRSHNIHVEESDYDLFGLYLPNPKDSLRIKNKIEQEYKIPHNDVEINGKIYEIDIELKDFRYYAVKKAINSEIHMDYFFFTPIVYMNRFPEIINKINENIVPKPFDFLARLRYLYIHCEKSLKKDMECLNKKLLTALVHGLQYFHCCVYGTFPLFDVFEEINYLKNELDNLIENKIINENEKFLLLQVFDLINYFYDEKKKGRKTMSTCIPDYIIKFKNWLENDFKYLNLQDESTKTKMDLDFFQDLLDEMLKNISFN
jgi:hypothetical protein